MPNLSNLQKNKTKCLWKWNFESKGRGSTDPPPPPPPIPALHTHTPNPSESATCLRIHAVRPESSLFAWRNFVSLSIENAANEDFDQTALIWNFVWRKCPRVRFLTLWLIFVLRQVITKTRLFKYIENFTTKKRKIQIKNSDIFHISARNIDCAYSLEPPRRGGSNEYPQSMFLSRNKKNNVYPCKPQFYYIKVGLKGVKII